MLNDICLAINFCVFVLISFGVINRRLIFLGAIIDTIFIFFLVKYYSRVYSYLNYTQLFLNIMLSLLFSITILVVYVRLFSDIIEEESLIYKASIEFKGKINEIKPLNIVKRVIGYMPLLILSTGLAFGLQSLLGGLLTKINLGVFKLISVYAVITTVLLLNYVFFLHRKDKGFLRNLIHKIFEIEDAN